MDNQARFERWVSTQSVVTKYGAKLHKGVTGLYKDLRIAQRYAAWQAALASQGEPNYQQKYLDLLAVVLDAKEVMLASGCKQADFPTMFAEFRALVQQPVSGASDLPPHVQAIMDDIEGELEDVDYQGSYADGIRVLKKKLAARLTKPETE